MQHTVKSLNTVVEVGLEVLSPLHIGGAGEKIWIKNIDYFYDGEEVKVLDQNKLVRALMEATTSSGDSALQAYQGKLAAGREWDISLFLEDCDIDYQDVAAKAYPVEVEPADEIRPLIRTGRNQTIIPGSSIKGAMRSVIFHKLFDQIGVRGDKPDRELLGDISNNIMKFIRPYDSECQQTAIVNCELFNLYQSYGNWESDYKPGFIISTEVFDRGATSNFRLCVADGLLTVLKEAQRTARRDLTPQFATHIINARNPVAGLFNMINIYTRVHLQREIDFFKKYNQAEDTDYIISNLEEYLQQATGENQCVLRLAYGSGFHAITGDWRFPDHTHTIRNPDMQNRVWNPSSRQREPARYKSRKITGLDTDATLMGFVKLTI